MKQTAVEWYAEEFSEHLKENYNIKITSLTLLAKAKGMEKQQQDEFAIAFAEWRLTTLIKNADEYTMRELLEIFKNK